MVTQITKSLYDQLIADFEVRSILSSSLEAEEIFTLREKAFEQFKQLGFPSTKVEDWKYTNLAPFLKDEFVTEQEDDMLTISEELIAKAKIKSLDCYNVILVNGKYRSDLSDTIPGENIFLFPLSAAMNKASFRDGLFLEVKSKKIIDTPLHIIHIVSAENNFFLQPRHLFVIGSHAEVNIVESYVTAGSKANVFVNNVSEIVIGEDSRLQHYYIQSGEEKTRYIHHTEVHQQTASLYNNYKASFPGIGLLRNNLNVVLNGENIESHLYGLYLSGGRQLIDNHTIVDHRKPHCQSNELYKGVMKDEAVGVFNGKIFVRKNAQKTNAFQQNNNLMLSKKAVVDSKPQLEIFADDVKCSHGSTVGQFNNEALFYLKSRGIGEEKARALLIHAFAYDVTEKIPIKAVQAHINQLIEDGLK